MGRELASKLRPSTEASEVVRRQEETSEARRHLDLNSGFSLAGAQDIRPSVHNAEIEALLTPQELLTIRDTLRVARRARRQLIPLQAELPHLAARAGFLEECPEVRQEIASSLNDQGEVLDEASTALAAVRAEVKLARERLSARLEAIVSSSQNAQFLQEPIITQRGGRSVIPVKADFKGRIPGIVHDESASGLTLFVEPLATVELNNELRELELAEEREVRRLLTHLTTLVAEEAGSLHQTVETLGWLDLILAKGRLSLAMDGSQPHVIAPKSGPAPGLQLSQARHPLLTDPVVPIDIHLGEDFLALVITGPNTGGKTVALKTVGLLGLMAQAGLHIPAEESSALPVFEGIYADIGDEQSIEQSLSTFSSHVGNITQVLAHATDRSLILLDELGAGTDPTEGTALAQAILSFLLDRGIPTIATSHYPELKIFAHATPGVQNASVEFDLDTLMPTYKLSIGLPGQSNALAIARRLGLPAEIVIGARSWLSAQDLEADQMLTDIRQAREEATAASAAALRSRELAQQAEAELKRRLAEVEELRREIVNQAREQAQAELASTRQKLKGIERRATRAAAFPQELLAATQESLAELAGLEPGLRPLPSRWTKEGNQVRVGDRVWVESLQQGGIVSALHEGEAELEMGNLKVRVGLDELEVREGALAEPPEVSPIRLPHPRQVSPELNLRGKRGEEVEGILGRYLDEAYLAGLREVRIIHGKGTGTLRRLVRQELETHPLVVSFRPGAHHEGGTGVTIVQFSER
jgi:DNA mismatch repair protein MutS2